MGNTSDARDVPGWAKNAAGTALHRVFRFRDFGEAWGFMSRVALLAERRDHHPNWSNAWNTVTIDLTTHDAGGITQNDLSLASTIETLVDA